MRVGVTGSRHGYTPVQEQLLSGLLHRAEEVHHGDCVGVDELAHRIATHLGRRVVLHPPDKDQYRAFCHPVTEAREPRPYLERNRAIVDETDLLIALVGGPEVKRSGTWATVRYGKKTGKPVMVIWPSGTIETLEIKT